MQQGPHAQRHGSSGPGSTPESQPKNKNHTLLIIGLTVGAVVFLALVTSVAMKDRSARSNLARPPTIASNVTPMRSRLEVACGVESDLAPKYVVRSQEHVDLPDVPRLKVSVSVPKGLSREELDAQMRHAAMTSYEHGGDSALGAVAVFAYASEQADGAYSAAKATLAPDGDWSKADPDVSLSRWSVRVEFAEGYFSQAAEAFANGTTITLADEDASAVVVSRSAGSWGDADVVARVPNGTKARVVGSRDFNVVDGKIMRRYNVEIATTHQRGWIMASYAHSP